MRRLAVSVPVALCIWLIFSWPLPRYCASGIASSSQNIETPAVRTLIPGDHLQLLYHFQLVSEMLRGRIPWLHNVYEFNTGDDAARREPRHYYVPFSIGYAVFSWVTGRACAWNLTGLLSVWLTYLFTWLLVGRYTRARAVAAAVAALALALPYRWVLLLGGSPAGFGMMWVPAVMLGLDLAVRELRVGGAVLAGFALLFARLCDVHVFFFSALLCPVWCLLALSARAQLPGRRLREWARLAVCLLPFVALAVLALSYSFWRGRELTGSTIPDGRGLGEVALGSPLWSHFWRWRASGLASHVYLGYALLVLMAAGLLAFFRGVREGAVSVSDACPYSSPSTLLRPSLRSGYGGQAIPTARARLQVALLLAMLAGVLVLALGTNGPFGGKLLVAVRKLIPPYAQVRQPVKIFCVLPTVLAVNLAVLGSALSGALGRSRARRAVLWCLLAAIMLEFRCQIRTTVCRLPAEQSAYAAVAADAREREVLPRVLALPIWPGDSSWTSIPQYYVSLYRIRMLNGYSPIVRTEYLDNVFLPLKSANKGWLTDAQLALLQGMKIDYVVLHENAFPERVSPFSVWFTLRRLLNHPRLALLAQADGVWAFRILHRVRTSQALQALADPYVADVAGMFPKGGGVPAASVGAWNIYSPARSFAARHCPRQKTQRREEDGTRYLSLEEPGARVTTKPTGMSEAPDLRWLIRARGHGSLVVDLLLDGEVLRKEQVPLDRDAWDWTAVPVGALPRYGRVAVRVAHAAARVDLDLLILAAGRWPELAAGESLEIPAICLFHAGCGDAATGSVTFRRDADPADIICYGPGLPLPAGRYRLDAAFAAEEGEAVLGDVSVDCAGGRTEWQVVRPGSVSVEFLHGANVPVRFNFRFRRAVDATLEKIVFVRVE